VLPCVLRVLCFPSSIPVADSVANIVEGDGTEGADMRGATDPAGGIDASGGVSMNVANSLSAALTAAAATAIAASTADVVDGNKGKCGVRGDKNNPFTTTVAAVSDEFVDGVWVV
jgi:hypothetical protein